MRLLTIIIFLFLLLTHVKPAQAILEWSPCLEDYKKYCAETIWESDQAAMCLEEFLVHSSENSNQKLTLACEKTVHHWQFHRICKEDIEKFCANLPTGEHRIHNCMRDNADQTSGVCRGFLNNYLGLSRADLDCNGPAEALPELLPLVC